MEIDHVFVSGAVVGRATTHEWGRSSLRAQRIENQWGYRQHERSAVG